jgi:NADH dehydrogenase
MILITGATGFVGRSMLARLAKHDVKVRILLSTKSDPEKLPQVPFEAAVGDITDAATLDEALKDVHTVIHLVGTETRGRHARLDDIDLEGTKQLIEACKKARIGRLIAVSRPAASRASAYRIKQVKGEIEEAIRSSGLAYTIFQCAVLYGKGDRFSEHIAMMAKVLPVYPLPGDGESVLQPLWVEDLVTCITISLESLDLIDEVVPVGGPELLTYRRIVMRVMFAVGARKPLVSIPFLVLRYGAWFLDGLFARWPITEMWAELLATNQTTELGNIERLFGFRPAAFDIGVIDHYLQQRGYWRRFLRYIFSVNW